MWLEHRTLLPGTMSVIKITLCLSHAGSCLLSGLKCVLQLLIGKPSFSALEEEL